MDCTVYSLPETNFNFQDVSLEENSREHLNEANKGSLGERIVQVIVDFFEAIIGQIVSLFEKIFASSPSPNVEETIDDRLNNAIVQLGNRSGLNKSENEIPAPAAPYNLNFLWVNLNPQDRELDEAQNIFKDGLDPYENAACIKDPDALRILEANEQFLSERASEDWRGVKESFTYKISRWADAQPKNTQINLWYDSALITRKAQQRTFEMMQAIAESRGVDLRLRDIRQLPNIEVEIRNSLHPATPVFYRVDLLKALIADYMMDCPEKTKYCIVSDADITPMSPKEMLDEKTVDHLDNDGYVFGYNKECHSDFENSFFIFNTEKENLKEIHYKTIIQKAASDIEKLRSQTIFLFSSILNSQYIFTKYRTFFEEMGEEEGKDTPRKEMEFPPSQFNGSNLTIPPTDHRSEEFRFIGDSNIPYTVKGRSNSKAKGIQIESLKDWKEVALATV